MAGTRTKQAAIAADDLLERPLGELSAADFVRALAHPSIQATGLGPIVADKKKYELWIEEGPIERIPLKDIIDRIRGEKKKVELEVPPWWHKVNPPIEEMSPQLEYGRLVEDVARLVEQRLRRK